MTTIRDVASKAGVSAATVSRVLNNQGYVHEETRKKVEEVIAELNFKPNSVARSLYKKKSKTIGFLIPDITNPFFPQLVRAVEEVMSQSGYHVFLFNTDEKIAKELEYIDVLKTKYVDGMIIVSNTIKWDHIHNIGVPVIGLDRQLDPQIPSVIIDNYGDARRAVRYLIDKGCKNLAHLKGPDHIFNAQERLRGYLDEMKEHGLPVLVEDGHYNLHDSMTATMRLFSKNTKIDGVFAGNDVMAVGALKAANKLGIHIPRDVLLMGFDGIEWATAVSPEISTMEQPTYDLGKKAAELLLEYIEGKTPQQQNFIFQSMIQERETTKRKR